MKRNSKYAFYITLSCGYEDTFIAYSTEERNAYIKNMLKECTFTRFEYCRIYASGEYGKRVKLV